MLGTGTLLSFETGNKKGSELGLYRKQWDVFRAGDIALGDKMFCNYHDLAMLGKRGVDSVVMLPELNRKPINPSHAARALGENDLVVEWKKPAWNKKSAYSREEWEQLPDVLILRQIRVDVSRQASARKASRSSPPCSIRWSTPPKSWQNSTPSGGMSNCSSGTSR